MEGRPLRRTLVPV